MDGLLHKKLALLRLSPLEDIRLAFFVETDLVSYLASHLDGSLFDFPGDSILCKLETVTDLS